MAVVQSGDRIWATSPQPPQDPTDAWSCPALWDLPSSPCCCPMPCQGCVPGWLSPPHTTPCATNSPELCIRAFSPCLQNKPPPGPGKRPNPNPKLSPGRKASGDRARTEPGGEGAPENRPWPQHLCPRRLIAAGDAGAGEDAAAKLPPPGLLLCRPPTATSPVPTPQGHLHRVMSAPPPHPHGAPGSPWAFWGPLSPSSPEGCAPRAGGCCAPRASGTKARAAAAPCPSLPFLAKKGVFGAAFGMNCSSVTAAGPLCGVRRAAKSTVGPGIELRAGERRKGGACRLPSNFRISVNVRLAAPGASGLLFLPAPCPLLTSFSESQSGPEASDLMTQRRRVDFFP